MKRVIVTGANGFIGKYLLKELSNYEVEVYAIVRHQQKNMDFIKNITVITCDLDNLEQLPNIIKERGFDAFYHLAWAGLSKDGKENYNLQLNNIKATCIASVIANQLACEKFVGIGSIAELAYRDYILMDNSKPELSAIYAIAKMTSNFMCKSICQENSVGFCWVYIANVYGIEDHTDNIINTIIKAYLKGESPILTDGEQLADFIYISDVARGLRAVGENGISGHNYYLGSNNIMPLKEYVEKIRDMVNPVLDTGLGRKKFRGITINFDEIDVDKIYRETGFKAFISFDEGIYKLKEWLQISNNYNKTLYK